MSFKNEWKDLQDATAGVPNSGDDLSVEPINRIAHQVIINEENITNKVDKEDGKGLSTNDFTDEYKEKVENSGEQVQSDWSQNDETAPDYVKNRTHYEIPEKVYGYASFTKEETGEGVNDSLWTVPLSEPLEAGVEYYYATDKGSGICTLDYDSHGNAILSLGDTGYSSTIYIEGEEYIVFYIGYDVEGYIEIGAPASAKELDEKYIPESIARVSDVEEILDELHAYAQNLIGGDA